MKKLFLALIITFCAASFSYAQFDFGIGSDISFLQVEEADEKDFISETLATVNLGGYIFINDSWYGIYRPMSVSLGFIDSGFGSDPITLLSLNFGLGFGAKWQINEEHSIIGGIAPVFTYFRLASDDFPGKAPSALLFGGGLDVHYQYEPFRDEKISFAFITGTRFQWCPVSFLNANDDIKIRQLIAIRPYAGFSIRFDTSRNNYVMTGPGF
ncbi:MAG: hypothetical protein ILP07_02160 [Treponema sp.]|nr:hypothetical protein [Treponema sp.]